MKGVSWYRLPGLLEASIDRIARRRCRFRVVPTWVCSRSTRARLVQEVSSPDANIIFSAVIDDALVTSSRDRDCRWL